MQIEETDLYKVAHNHRQHPDGRFHNPFNRTIQGNPLRVLRWKLLSKNHFRSDYHRENVTPVSIDWDTATGSDALTVTFINHASILIKDLDSVILVDPVFFGLSPLIKDFTPLVTTPDQMPNPDHVLITHGHYDHLDKASLLALPRNTHVITPRGYDSFFNRLAMTRHTQLDWFDRYEQGNTAITLLPCNHWTMRNPITGPNRSLWGSYLIQTASGMTIYVSGDTAYFNGFGDIGKMFSIDLAILSVGAYEPRWFMAASHMNPAEAVKAFQELEAKRLIVVHWGTFRLGDEPVFLPPIQIKEELSKVGLSNRFIDIKHGKTYDFSTGI